MTREVAPCRRPSGFLTLYAFLVLRGIPVSEDIPYRRDATMREDHAQLRMGHAPEMLVVLNNTVLGLFARQGATDVAHARREFAYHFEKALASW